MNYKLSTIAFLFSLLLWNCANDEVSQMIRNGKITKKIVTTNHKLEVAFDEKIPGDFIYKDFGDELKMDFTGRIKYYDEYGNIIVEEEYDNIKINSDGNHVNSYSPNEKHLLRDTIIIKRRTIFYFGDPSLPRIDSSRTIDQDLSDKYDASGKEIVTRNDKGKRTIYEKYLRGKLMEKVIYEYNPHGQRKKMLIYKEDGLDEIWELFYDDTISMSITSQRNTKLNEDSKYEVNYEYRYNEKGLQTSMVLNGNIGEVRIKAAEKIEYYDEEVRKTIRMYVDRKLVDIYQFNEKGDCISKDCLDDNRKYTCSYSYNSKGDWFEAIITEHPSKDEYIVKRKISYY